MNQPNREYALPDSTTDTPDDTNALHPNNPKEYDNRHHLPKATNKHLRASNEFLNYGTEPGEAPQLVRSGPKTSREENLPGSVPNADGLPNPYYDHTDQQMPHLSQRYNNDRIIQNLSQYAPPEHQADIPFSSILDKHTAIYRQYALPDTTNTKNYAANNHSQNKQSQNQRKESQSNSKNSVESTSSHSPTRDDKPITQYNAPIISAPSEFSDESPLAPMSISFSNMRTMPASEMNLTERQLPTEYVAVPVKKVSQIPKQNKPKKKNTPPIVPVKPNLHTPAPVKYIPINLDNPMVNPEFVPKMKGKIAPTKKVTPPKRPPSPIEYIPIPVNPTTGHPQGMGRPQKGLRPHPGANRPRNRTPAEGPVFLAQPHEAQRYVLHPSAPRPSFSSAEGWRSDGPSSFASIDPRKLRTQRVSPMIFIPTVPIYKPM